MHFVAIDDGDKLVNLDNTAYLELNVEGYQKYIGFCNESGVCFTREMCQSEEEVRKRYAEIKQEIMVMSGIQNALKTEQYRCKHPINIRLNNGDDFEIKVGEIFDFDFQLTNGVSLENDKMRFYVEQKNFEFCFKKVE